MSKMKQLYAEITDLYDEQGLAADEIAAVLAVPQSVVEEVIADFEAQLDMSYGEY
jgi:DNA-binding transcriptional regulator LsrR (DeoR family)